jgi:hypothetical protein
MSFVPAMWGVWAALVLITLVLNVFKGRLERDEEDQIFLDDSFEHERAAQAQIVAKVNKMEPILRMSMIATTCATVVVILYYLRDIYVQLFGK